MVFASSTAYGTRLLAQRVNPQGVAFEQEPLVIADIAQKAGSSYEVVYLNGEYVVIFNADSGPQGKQIYARTVTTDGTVGAEVRAAAQRAVHRLQPRRCLGQRQSADPRRQRQRREHRTQQPIFPHLRQQPAATDRARSAHLGLALSGDTEPVNGGWVTSWADLPSHDAPRATIIYAVIALDGSIVTPATPITSNYPGGGRPTVVSNGGAAGSEAMIIYTQARDAINPQIVNEDAILARRVSADGTLIGGPITLIDEPQLQTTPKAVFDGTNYVLTWTDQRNYPYPAQSRDDIFAARVGVDGTVLDPGGFPVADSFRPEQHGDVAVAGGQVMFAYRTFRYEMPWGSYRLAAREMLAADGQALNTVAPPMLDADAIRPSRSISTSR